jgi:hypothetical protein
MVKGALGNMQFVQNILDGHLLETLGEDQLLGYIQDLIAFNCIFIFFDDPCHN